MKAWLFQDSRQKNKLGDKCPWSVGWYDPDGKKKSRRVGSKSVAQKFLRKIEGQLAAGTYDDTKRINWRDFRAKYEKTIAAGLSIRHREEIKATLKKFETLIKPKRLASVRTATIDEFIAKRRLERGKRPGSKISIATVNKDLRNLKAVFRKAYEWGHLARAPQIKELRELRNEARYIPASHFQAIYNACNVATFPKGLSYPAADWWKALVAFAYMTGWRIGEILSLRRDELDLQAGTATLKAEKTKGRRGAVVPLHPFAIEHLGKIESSEPNVFPWYHCEKTLYRQFGDIQRKAEIKLPCDEDHVHGDSCHVYGFHDLRRAFATVNAETLSGDELQRLMRHKSYSTTQRYVNMANRLNRAVGRLAVPIVAKSEG